MKTTQRCALLLVAIASIGMAAASCGGGGGVQGNTYEGNGGIVRIEFKSGGQAFVSTGPVTTTCTYSESGKQVTLVCEGDKILLTVEEDGALSGPQGGIMGGMLGRLTKKK